MERKLVTIVCADVAGYSRLIGLDEEGTIARLREHQGALINPKIAEHAGRIVKTMGDGLLVEFGSPVEAVRCAVEVQVAIATREATISEDCRIRFRIGINLGDVIAEDDDVLGDGVNIAARLQLLADVGGICVSRSVRDQVRDRLAVEFEDMGEQSVRNIARPIQCYRVCFDGAAPRPPKRKIRKRWLIVGLATVGLCCLAGGVVWLSTGIDVVEGGKGPTSVAASIPESVKTDAEKETARLSIVVLPFRNLSNEPDQDYFADSLTDDITTDLSRIAGSFVISRNTAFTFKGTSNDERTVANALSVRYLLEGSVRRTGDQVRVNARLIDGSTGGQLWSERFEHDMRDIAAFQDEVTGRIVNALSLELVATEAHRAQLAHPNDPDAVDLTMRGWWLLRQPADRQRMLDARQLFERALERDPQFVPGLLGLATTHADMVFLTWSEDRDTDLERADAVLAQVLAVAPQNAVASYIRAHVFFGRGQLQDAIDACEASLALDHNYASAYGFLAAMVRLDGHPERSVKLLQRAMLLSPRDPEMWTWLQYLGRAQSDLGQAEDAIANFRRAIAINPTAPAYQWTLLSTAYARAKRPTEAREAMDTFLRLSPHLMDGRSDEVMRAMQLQIQLAVRGYYLGVIDGDIGKQTRKALAWFQRDQGIAASEQADDETVRRLGLSQTASGRVH
ncbi:adenylate/guanylate cyclase domain-containing protein (plasmid) [Ensifer adhaerens]|uniref:tetratricopeptide repeat protein n=1 Tax=Ensifer adhaerens TaxID=106592 RepID=UPI0023A9E976|nr:adenylate/guanylate cyclase domain-containing protein [Ensifer adhaerens]WDZ81967.1 adenylate/guanylate cyclase domain-containing protein [Ensifer adhaerens]